MMLSSGTTWENVKTDSICVCNIRRATSSGWAGLASFCSGTGKAVLFFSNSLHYIFLNMSKYLQKLHLMDSSLYKDSLLYILLRLLQSLATFSSFNHVYRGKKKTKSNSVLVYSVISIKVYVATKISRYSFNYTSDFYCVQSEIPQARPASAGSSYGDGDRWVLLPSGC